MWQNDLVTLYNADSIELLPTLSIAPDLIIADPPYGNIIKDKWDNQWKTQQDYLQWSQRWIEPIIALMPEHGSFYIFGGVGEKSDNIIHLKLLIDSLGLYFKDWITWAKSRGMGNRRGWMYTREEILWYVKDNKQFIWNTDSQYSDIKRKHTDFGYYTSNGKHARDYIKSEFLRHRNVWTLEDDLLLDTFLEYKQQRSNIFTDISEQTYNTRNQLLHYTPKPEKLIERIILVHTKENDLVFDPFLGSGTTCAVAQRLGRRCIGIEKDVDYFAASVKRIDNV